MTAPMIPRKPLAVHNQACVKELDVNMNTVDGSGFKAPDHPQKEAEAVAANLEWKAAPDRSDIKSRFWSCFSGNHTSAGGHTLKRTPSLKERFSHTLTTLLPQQRYFHNHISRRTLLLIMLAFTTTCLVALIVGLAAGLPTSKYVCSPTTCEGLQG
jgi:hypothetical protein